jgi:hypothetical protein
MNKGAIARKSPTRRISDRTEDGRRPSIVATRTPINRIPGVCPALLQNPVKYATTMTNQATPVNVPTSVPVREAPTSEATTRTEATPTRASNWASAASRPSATPRLQTPANVRLEAPRLRRRSTR